jgi:hypothetical protein
MLDPRREYGTGWRQWNPQAWLDWAICSFVMGRLEDVIPKTYVPILQLASGDPDAVEADYAAVVARRDPVARWDSPRERWRKRYGAFVRELEWVYGALRRHFPPREYEELAVDLMHRALRDQVWTFFPSRARGDDEGDAPSSSPQRVEKLRRVVEGRAMRWWLRHLNPMSFMVGPVELSVADGGALLMFVPRCWWHTAVGDGRTQDQSCLLACKGGSERLFESAFGIRSDFEPHLPDYSCTIRIETGL